MIDDLYARDQIAAGLGIELIERDGARVVVAFDVDERHIGWHGRCHGGVLFTAADVAMSYVSNRHDATALATHAAIDWLGAVEMGDRVRVEAVESTRRGRTAICTVTLRVADSVVAVFHGSTLAKRD